MAQERRPETRLTNVLRAAGIESGQRLGVVGWKYTESNEVDDPRSSFFVPAIIIDALRQATGDSAAVTDVTPILMHPNNGLRATNEVEQIAAFEWAAAQATGALWRIVTGTRPGMSERQAVAQMQFAGQPLSAHVLFAAGKDQIVGLRSATERILEESDAVSAAVGFWGGLGCRAGLLAREKPDFLKRIAEPYFRALATWYQTVGVGVRGKTVFERVTEVLAEAGLRSALNPGHLTSFDEWVHSPIRRESTEKLLSGMAFQCDIIPTPMARGEAINCEDPLVFADAALRLELQLQYPRVWERIAARRAFMINQLGLELDETVLPLSNTPAYLPPFWLRPNCVLTAERASRSQ